MFVVGFTAMARGRLPTGTVAGRLCALAHEKGMALQDITAIYLLLEQKQV